MTLKDICILLLSKLYLNRQLCNGLGVSGGLAEHTFKGLCIKMGNTRTFVKLVSDNWQVHEDLCCHCCFQLVIFQI